MPYINPARRVLLNQEITALKDLLGDPSVNPGDFNYAITRLLLPRLAVSYRSINAVMGILQCVGAEFYRRVAVPYEQQKRDLNGEVYGRWID